MRHIEPFGPEHVDDATALVVRRVKDARSSEPLIPRALDDPERVAASLGVLAGRGLGTVAVDGGELEGFLTALPVTLWGSPGAYVPEWGHVVSVPEAVTPLHEAASRAWVDAGLLVQAVSLWTDEPAVEARWHHLGFGRAVVDTVRDLAPVSEEHRVEVRRAAVGDAATVSELEHALWEHLAAPPISRVHPEPEGEPAVAARLGDPGRPVWLALDGSSAIGYLALEPNGEIPLVFSATEVCRCDGAYVVPAARRGGAATALLDAGLRWAAEQGLARCAVDYESANPDASRFWPAVGCRAVVHSVARRLAAG